MSFTKTPYTGLIPAWIASRFAQYVILRHSNAIFEIHFREELQTLTEVVSMIRVGAAVAAVCAAYGGWRYLVSNLSSLNLFYSWSYEVVG